MTKPGLPSEFTEKITNTLREMETQEKDTLAGIGSVALESGDALWYVVYRTDVTEPELIEPVE
ncbi:hypothetical protein [Nocardia aurantia]|uniref:Uncharacterized protein n=1 Tax=Nocardia aurantia TaxID=2585199 RepID=A0A7K0DX61_9NOCA|nr:hypothetical protein [Nocardia aurantia]MQY30366.1 hypothetical protein [Nocardia aurantia]